MQDNEHYNCEPLATGCYIFFGAPLCVVVPWCAYMLTTAAYEQYSSQESLQCVTVVMIMTNYRFPLVDEILHAPKNTEEIDTYL
jgi:hypothetical protein